MSPAIQILITLTLGLIGTIISSSFNKKLVGGVFKVLASFGFLILITRATPDMRSILAFEVNFILLAYTALWIGDMSLSVLTYIRGKNCWFTYGNRISQFGYACLFMHLAYTNPSLFEPSHVNFVTPESIALFTLIIANVIQLRLLNRGTLKWRILNVILYALIISYLIIISYLLRNPWLIFGTSCIYLSDSILIHSVYGKLIRVKQKYLELVYAPLYYIGLACITYQFII